MEDETVRLYSDAVDVINYLNQVANTDYHTDHAFVVDRLRQGYTVSQCKAVIDNKANDPWYRQQGFCNPKTLFRQPNFDKYLQAINAPQHNNTQQYTPLTDYTKVVPKAQRDFWARHNAESRAKVAERERAQWAEIVKNITSAEPPDNIDVPANHPWIRELLQAYGVKLDKLS